MTGVAPQVIPTTIESYIVQLERRVNDANGQPRGTGRTAWGEATIMLSGATIMDGAVPGWRILSDGRVELRGRVTLAASLTNPAPPALPPEVLRLPGICAPPGNGGAFRSWVSCHGPCSSEGSNPGMVRLDVERTLVDDPLTGDTIIYASVYARPPMTNPLGGWIGFDHAIFDPNLYQDVLDLIPEDQFNTVFGRGVMRDDGQYIVAPQPTMGPPTSPETAPIPEYEIAFIGDGDQIITVIPGVEGPVDPGGDTAPPSPDEPDPEPGEPTGPTGSTGPTGPTGSTGSTGPTGP